MPNRYCRIFMMSIDVFLFILSYVSFIFLVLACSILLFMFYLILTDADTRQSEQEMEPIIWKPCEFTQDTII